MGEERGAASVGCLVDAADFERVLRLRSLVQGPHFALHHLSGVPGRTLKRSSEADLSTAPLDLGLPSVEDSPVTTPDPVLPGAPIVSGQALWLGAVVPKRHAKRAVTRNLMKRQIRALFRGQAKTLPPGLWVVRLRAGFDRARFPSAASTPLREAVRAELDGLIRRCVAGAAAQARPAAVVTRPPAP